MKKTTSQPKRELLDADTLAALDEGIRLAQNGQRWTLEEAFDLVRKRRAAWAKKPNDSIAA